MYRQCLSGFLLYSQTLLNLWRCTSTCKEQDPSLSNFLHLSGSIFISTAIAISERVTESYMKAQTWLNCLLSHTWHILFSSCFSCATCTILTVQGEDFQSGVCTVNGTQVTLQQHSQKSMSCCLFAQEVKGGVLKVCLHGTVRSQLSFGTFPWWRGIWGAAAADQRTTGKGTWKYTGGCVDWHGKQDASIEGEGSRYQIRDLDY